MEQPTSKAERLEVVRTLAASNVAPDKIVLKGRELGLSSEEIANMHRTRAECLTRFDK